MKHLFTLLLSVFLLMGQVLIAQNTNIKPELKDYLKKRVDEGFNPGVSMAYLSADETSFFNFGKTKLTDGTAVDEFSVYEIGSITKVFTCIVLADEVLKGRMKLDDPISKYLPESVNVPSLNGNEITLQHLATHTSGLPRMPDNFNPADQKNPFADYTVASLYEFLNAYMLQRNIGVQYEYSNLGMGLLGHILELHTGLSYEALVKERITEPLGMTDTGISLSDEMKAHLAYGHDSEVKQTKNWDLGVLAGAGALRSTTTDMVKFLRANISNDGSDLYRAMDFSHQFVFETEGNDFKIGLGWHFSNNNTIVWHNGGTGGYRTFAGFLKNAQEAVVVLTNSTFSLDGVGLAQLGQSLDLVMPKKLSYPDTVMVEEKVLESYVGKYQLAPAFFISISKEKTKMIAQATGQAAFEIFPSSENEFFLKVVEATVTFNKDDQGKVVSLTLNQNGQAMEGRRVE